MSKLYFNNSAVMKQLVTQSCFQIKPIHIEEIKSKVIVLEISWS